MIISGSIILCLISKVNQVLAVEKAFRRRPFNKVFSIARKKIYPNSQITSIQASEIKNLSKRKQKWKKFLNYVSFALWGGERYDTLKTITDNLSRSEVRYF